MKWIALVLLICAVATGAFAAGYLCARQDDGDPIGACVGTEAPGYLACSSEQAVERYEERHEAVCIPVRATGRGGRGAYFCRAR